MPKFLIDSEDDTIRSAHVAPLDFSVSGRYVVDVPQNLEVVAPTNDRDALITEKVEAFKKPQVANLPLDHHDELFASPNIDTALSSDYLIGPNKKTAMLPGGVLMTNPLVIAVTVSFCYVHWYGFTLKTDPGPQPPSPVPVQPPPPRLMYNYDPSTDTFVEFNPLDVTVDVMDSAGTGVLLTPSVDALTAFAFSPGSLRLRFTNSSTETMYLSDWIFLYNSV